MAGRCSANLRSAGEPPPRCASTVDLNNSSSKPFIKTYSKRTLQNLSEPCRQRQRVEGSTKGVGGTANSGFLPSTPTLSKKRSISEYFQPVTYTKYSSSPQSSVFSSDPVQKNVDSPPSSPPLRCTPPSARLPKARKRRRLTTRIPLGVITMSDINSGCFKDDGDEGHRDKGKPLLAKKGPFYPGSPERKSYLGKLSPPGRRQAARGGTSSEEGGDDNDDDEYGVVQTNHNRDDIPRNDSVDIADARICQPEELYIPFAPQRPYRLHGLGPRRSDMTPTHQMSLFNSSNTLMGRPETNLDAAANTAVPSVAGPFSLRGNVSIDGNLEENARSEILQAAQSIEQDLPPFIADGFTHHDDHAVSGVDLTNAFHTSRAAPNSAENLAQIASNPVNAEISTRSDIAGPSGVQDAANLISGGDIQSNIPVAGNITQGQGNLVQTQLALGSATNITCNMCRFVYNRTVPADVSAHSQYHDAHNLGEPVTGLIPTSRYILQAIDTGIGQGDYVILVDNTSTQGWKNLAVTVLERHVDMELATLPIDLSRLWSSLEEPGAQGNTMQPNRVNRFQIYMYVRRHEPKLGRVVSLLVAERITAGCETRFTQIEHDDFGPWPAIVPRFETVISSVSHEAILGVNRFWTARSSRKKGFAKTLLRQARQNMIRLYTIPRIHVAWTYTTEDGAKFAKRYLENKAPYDFLTYSDQE